MSVIITGRVYKDAANYTPLVTPIGPFPNKRAALAFMSDMAPLWGEWGVEILSDPEIERARRTLERSGSGGHERRDPARAN